MKLLSENRLKKVERGLWYITLIVVLIAFFLSIVASFKLSGNYLAWSILWASVFVFLVFGLIRSHRT